MRRRRTLGRSTTRSDGRLRRPVYNALRDGTRALDLITIHRQLQSLDPYTSTTFQSFNQSPFPSRVCTINRRESLIYNFLTTTLYQFSQLLCNARAN